MMKWLGIGLLVYGAMQYAKNNRAGLAVVYADGTMDLFPHWNDPALDIALRQPNARTFAYINGAIGHEYRIEQFEGGWLADDCPLQVLWGEGWLPGQVEALQDAGRSPSCPVLVETYE